MNNAALVSRSDPSTLPSWSPASPGYLALEGGQTSNAQAAKLVSTLKKYWWLLLLCWAVVAIPFSIWIYKNVMPKYTAIGAFNVAPTIVNIRTGKEAAPAFYTEYVRTQAELMKNPYVLQKASTDPRLTRHEHFRKQHDQVGYLLKNVDASPVPNSQNINVSMTHEDPAFAADVVNSVMDAYRWASAQQEAATSTRALEELEKLHKAVMSDISKSQSDLDKLTADGSSVWSEESRKILADSASTLRATLLRLESDRATMATSLENVKNKPSPNEATFRATINPDTDAQVERWTAERMRLQMQDNVLESKRATPQHPDRIEIRNQLKVLDQKITARKKELQDNAWSFYQANAELEKSRRVNDMSADMKALDQQIASLKTRVEENDNQARTYGSKTQSILNLRETIADYKEMAKRYRDRIAEVKGQDEAMGRVSPVGDKVEAPKTPAVDKRPRFALAANAAGILLGLIALFMVARLNNRIENSDDLPEPMKPLVIGSVSHAGGNGTSPAGKVRRKILGEEMRLVHANLLPPGANTRRIMMVTSPTPGNGKTSIADQLATSLAKSGLEVLLIDGDLRKRDLSTRFDVGFRPGLTELLQGKQPELIQPMELLPNLRLMGAGGRFDRNPVELFQRKHIRECLDGLRDKFDCIVIDTPPTLVVADARLMATSCDEILCVVRANMTNQKDIDQTMDALSRISGKTPKIIVNGVEHRQSYYKYKFSYATQNERDGAAPNVQSAG